MMLKEILSARHILNSDAMEDIALRKHLPSLCRALTTKEILDLVRWCIQRDIKYRKNNLPSRLTILIKMVMEHRPDANEIGHTMFFFRSTPSDVLSYIVDHKAFNGVVGLANGLHRAHMNSEQNNFFQLHLELLANHHPLAVTTNGTVQLFTFARLREVIRHREGPCLKQTHNAIDPLSLDKLNTLPIQLHFAIGKFTFDVVYMGIYLQLTPQAIMNEAFSATYFPCHPFTKETIRYEVIEQCKTHLATLWRSYAAFF